MSKAARYLVPYLRLFPIWRYGPRYDAIDGHYIDEGWFPDPYGSRTFRTEAEALAQSPERGV